MQTVEDRAVAVLAAIRLEADTRAASGRYRRSKPIRPGVRYWATSRLRQQEDVFGVQFYGEGLREARRLQRAFERAHFEIRNPETSKITYACPIAFGPGKSVDVEGIATARRTIDTILGSTVTPTTQGASFLEFMRASPWADIEIDLPDRVRQPDRPTGL
ncbi:hypothetical protein [Brevundimonas aveniformis]|uniref:hypothetical protein n=1 Tax=Brevundimonas aveniformis TaxID=370977 RepID=UPI00249121A5|nr:hypothetical protein [Brevundimonas aveniformis]